MFEREAVHRQQADLLDVYCERVGRNPDEKPPAALEPTLAMVAQRLARNAAVIKPGREFAQVLRQRLEAQAESLAGGGSIVRAKTLPIRTSVFRPGWLPLAGLVMAVAVIAALISTYLWAVRPQPVSAQEIIQKAQAVAASPEEGGVRSFVLVEVSRSRPSNPRLNALSGLTGDEEILSENKRWYEAPNRWRSEYEQRIVTPDGKEVSHYRSVQVSDGTDLWQYDPDQNIVIVNRLDPAVNSKGGVSLFGQEVKTLNDLLQQAGVCYNPRVTGSDTVAGRATYVVDLGQTQCPSVSAPEMNGRFVIWVDEETFFVLKQELHNPKGNQVIITREVTQVAYNVPIDPVQFTFTPPTGAKVVDNRPQPMPSTDQFYARVEQLARQADFPIFVPDYVPEGFQPQQPKLDPTLRNVVVITYVPSDGVEDEMKGFTVQQQRAASYSLVARWTENADPITIASGKGWVRRGLQSAHGTGSDSAALVLRDGTLVSISSFVVTPEELIKIAASLRPAPGSHAPLPNPTPPSLSEIRRRVSFPVFIPTYVPAGLTPEPPIGGEEPGENVEIKYHTSTGAVGLIVQNGAPGCCPGLLPMESEEVTLPNGITAHLIRARTTVYGGMTLWWEQEGTVVSVSGPDLTEEELLKIAASMSKTADPAQPKEPPACPTPTPEPPPKFQFLRPTWLPEPLTVREEIQPGLPETGPWVIITFDPRPDDEPHEVLTLIEMPKAMVGKGGSPDPQATREVIGGREVWVIRRGENCTALSWEEGDLVLELTNAYDPPGHLRYTCDQLRKIVESIP